MDDSKFHIACESNCANYVITCVTPHFYQISCNRSDFNITSVYHCQKPQYQMFERYV